MVKSTTTTASSSSSSSSVEQVEIQQYLSKLKELVPHMPRHRKVSKLEVIQHVIDYICDLQTALEQKQQKQAAAAIARHRRARDWQRRRSQSSPSSTQLTSTSSILQPLGNLSAIPPSPPQNDVIFYFILLKKNNFKLNVFDFLSRFAVTSSVTCLPNLKTHKSLLVEQKTKLLLLLLLFPCTFF